MRRTPINPNAKSDRPQSHYEILGISPHASDDDIRSAYRVLAFKFHPDRQPKNGIGILRAQHFRLVSEAYTTLKSPENRANYDALIGLKDKDANNDNVWHSIAGLFRK